MKAKLMIFVFLFFVSFRAFSATAGKLNCEDLPSSPNGVVASGPIHRTFNPSKNTNHNVNLNFKSALFSITNSSIGLSSNTSIYSLYFDGKIDVTPGGNKFWDLSSNAEVIDELENQMGADILTTMNFKDCNYTKSYYLPFLGQSVKANEYYVIADGGI